MNILHFLPFLLVFVKPLIAQSNDFFKPVLDVINPNDLQKILEEILQKLPRGACVNQVATLALAVRNGDDWALKMLDAWAKPQSGILFGNTMHVGNFDECLEINGGSVKGKYCTAMVNPHPKYGKYLADFLAPILGYFERSEDEKNIADKARLSYGLCVPRVCTASIIQNITSVLEETLKLPLHFDFVDDYCDDGTKEFSRAAVAAIVVFSLFAVILICGTVYDILVYKNLPEDQKQPNLLIAFSMYTNSEKLFSTKSAEGNLKCLNGLRVISMMWVIIAHVFQSMFFAPHTNAMIIRDWKDKLENSFMAASSMAVDTFFVISGLLVVFLYLKTQDKGIKFSLPMFYFHRLIRLTPTLAMTLLFTSTLHIYMGNGPFWPAIYEIYQRPCERHWWSTLIYLQNYIHPNEQCLGQAWYLAVDTQMYFLSPLVFLPLLRWPKQTLGAVSVFILLNCSYVFEMTWKQHWGTTFFNQSADHFKHLYTPTHVRGTTYLIGMICGYFVYQSKSGKAMKLTKGWVTILWLFSLAVLIAIVLGHSPMISASEYNVLDSSMFNAFTRVGWAIALSVIIVLCVNGYGGPIDSFLSNDIFTVLIRLNYSVYLTHLLVLTIQQGQGRTQTYFSNLQGFHDFWGTYVFTLGVSYLWSLAFEMPVLTIEKMLLGRKITMKKSTSLERAVAVEIYKNNLNEPSFKSVNCT